MWERSGSVENNLTRDRRAASSSLTGVTVLCPWARYINTSLVLVQLRKTCPYITARLLMGRKESNQTNKKTANFKNGIKFWQSYGFIKTWFLCTCIFVLELFEQILKVMRCFFDVSTPLWASATIYLRDNKHSGFVPHLGIV